MFKGIGVYMFNLKTKTTCAKSFNGCIQDFFIIMLYSLISEFYLTFNHVHLFVHWLLTLLLFAQYFVWQVDSNDVYNIFVRFKVFILLLWLFSHCVPPSSSNDSLDAIQNCAKLSAVSNASVSMFDNAGRTRQKVANIQCI